MYKGYYFTDKFPTPFCKRKLRRKEKPLSMVWVQFPDGSRYYYLNRNLDLKKGDYVFVEGTRYGIAGLVTDIEYRFKVKKDVVKWVISRVDSRISGNFYLGKGHLLTFDPKVLPPRKFLTWVKAPDREEYYVGSEGEGEFYPLEKPNFTVSGAILERGKDYFLQNRVIYLSLSGEEGFAVVDGTEPYTITFTYRNNAIGNLVCDCPYGGFCKHEVALFLELKLILQEINDHFQDEFQGSVTAVSDALFTKFVLGKPGKSVITVKEDNQ